MGFGSWLRRKARAAARAVARAVEAAARAARDAAEAAARAAEAAARAAEAAANLARQTAEAAASGNPITVAGSAIESTVDTVRIATEAANDAATAANDAAENAITAATEATELAATAVSESTSIGWKIVVVATIVGIGGILAGASFVGGLDSVFLEQEFPVHGNYCGPKHGSDPQTDPPLSAVDRACMIHDACYKEQGDFDCGCDLELLANLPTAIDTDLENGNAEGVGAGQAIYGWFSAQSPISCLADKIG